MSTYHHHLQTKSRGKGASAIAAAAYRSRSDLYDEELKKYYRYLQRASDLALSLLIAEWAEKLNRGDYWQSVERAETRKNAQLAFEIVVALPSEVTDQDRAEIAIQYAEWLNKRYNVIVDLNIHKPQEEGEKNYHAHLMFSTRESWIDQEGSLQLAKNKSGTIRNLVALQTSSAEVELQREIWETIINAKLDEKGLPTVSRKSVKDRQEPRLAKPFFPRWMIQWEQRNGTKHPRRIEWETKNSDFQDLVGEKLIQVIAEAKAKEEAEKANSQESITDLANSPAPQTQFPPTSPETDTTPETQPAPITRPKPKPKPPPKKGFELG